MGTTYGTPRTKGRERIIAIITVAMMIVSILSLTVWAAAEDAYYTPVVEAPSEYAPNEPPSSDTESDTSSESDGEYSSEQESNEPDSSVPDGNTDSVVGDDIDAELSDDNSSDDYQGDVPSNANESEDEYEYGDEDYEEKLCTCECEYYCDYDCICECEDCYVEIEALADFVVTDWDGLHDVFTNLMTTDGPYTVDVVGNITMSAQLNIPVGRTVNLDGGGVLYQPTSYARHFFVYGTLILDEITLRGAGDATYRGGIAINASGELVMNAGSIVSGNTSLSGGGIMVNGGELIMNTGSIIEHNSTSWWGGGIRVDNGVFTMYGGRISNNASNSMGDIGNVGFGGAILIRDNSIFTMNDGVIENNSSSFLGGGVAGVNSTFTMNGGAITGNNSTVGGGVIFELSDFTMNGGTISGNKAIGSTWSSGGGVYMLHYSAFAMTGGTIHENMAMYKGGGVYAELGSIFTMTGGIISGNKARYGGGVEVALFSTFTMHGGTISENEAQDGGGIYIASMSDFIMNGGMIRNNTSSRNGGGVFTAIINAFTMNDGTISENTAHENGGGLYIWRQVVETFSMTGGAIINNAAETGDGGGIFSTMHENYPNPLTSTAYNNFKFENGTVSGNIAGTGRYAPPINYYERAFGHLLNNYDINFRGSHRVEAITFDLSGGNVGGNSGDIEVLLEYSIQLGILNIPVPERFGYSLIGWLYEDELLTTAQVAERVIDRSLTFVAQWEEIEQTISYYEYRNISIYYYLEGYGYLVNDTVNNVIGREYVRRAGTIFSLAHIVDRNELASDNDYVFESWGVYVDGMRDDTYIIDKSINQLRGSFIVPMSSNDKTASISLVAVWSIYEAQENGNGDSSNNNDVGENGNNDNGATTPENEDDPRQKGLPQTGVEGNALLWSTLLTLVFIICLYTTSKIRNIRQKGSLSR